MFTGKVVRSSVVDGTEAVLAVLSAAARYGLPPEAFRVLHDRLPQAAENPVELLRLILPAALQAGPGGAALRMQWSGWQWQVSIGGAAEIVAARSGEGWRVHGQAESHHLPLLEYLLYRTRRVRSILWELGGERRTSNPLEALRDAITGTLSLVLPTNLGEHDHLAVGSTGKQPLRSLLAGLARGLSPYEREYFAALKGEFDRLDPHPSLVAIAEAMWKVQHELPFRTPLELTVNSRFAALHWGSERSPVAAELRRSFRMKAAPWMLYLYSGATSFRTEAGEWYTTAKGDSSALRQAQIDCHLQRWSVFRANQLW